jgi:hypothetical protein
MKRKWKYDKHITLNSVMSVLPVLIGITTVLLISSCSSRDKHKHIPTNNTSEVDGLAQPANQTVFSGVKTISAQDSADG